MISLIKKTLLTTSYLLLVLVAEAQNCEDVFVPPATVNGIEVTATFSGSVHVFPDEYVCCSTYTTPPNSIWLGQTGPFSYTFHFSEPISELTFVLAAAGQWENENFIFTTNTGTPAITDLSSCYSSVSGNVILSGLDATLESGGGGGLFRIVGPLPFTALTVTGNGGVAGSLAAICLGYTPPTVVPACADVADLDKLVLPNVITANGDLINDVFQLPSDYAECFDFELQLLNRWGEVIYSFTNDTQPFKGLDQDGNELTAGVYLYVLKSNGQQKTGFLSVIR